MKYGIKYIFKNADPSKWQWTSGWFKDENNKSPVSASQQYIEDINMAFRGVEAAQKYWKEAYHFWVDIFEE